MAFGITNAKKEEGTNLSFLRRIARFFRVLFR